MRDALIAAAVAAGKAEQEQQLVDLYRDYNTAVERAAQAEDRLIARKHKEQP